MMKTTDSVKAFIRSILAGMMIGIGGTVYISCDNRYVGSFLFALGLLVIIIFKLDLFTGKVGYLVYRKTTVPRLILVWLGNLIGAVSTGMVLYLTRLYPVLSEKAKTMCEVKVNDSYLSVLILGFFCGMLMFIAVDGYKSASGDSTRTVIIFLPVIVFILCGFEHCVADMYYVAIAGEYTLNSLIFLLIVTVGNTIGALTTAYGLKKSEV